MRPHKHLLIQISRYMPYTLFKVLEHHEKKQEMARVDISVKNVSVGDLWHKLLEAWANTENLDICYFNNIKESVVYIFFNDQISDHVRERFLVTINLDDFYYQFLYACDHYKYLEPSIKINWRKEGF